MINSNFRQFYCLHTKTGPGKVRDVVTPSGVYRVCQAWRLEPLFRAQHIHKLQSCINTAPSRNALSRACCISTTKHYDKTTVLWHSMRVWHSDRTRTLAHHIHETCRSHAIRKDKSVCAAAFQARIYQSESGWEKFKAVTVRIWLLRK